MRNSKGACPICGSSTLDWAFPVKSNADGIISGYDIWCCRECNVGLTNPVPESEELSKHYTTGIYGKSGGRADRLISRALSILYDQRFREIDRFHSPPGKLLDVGCGKGRFVARAVERGWDAQGIDTASGQVAAARERYSIKISPGEIHDIEFQDNYFDVITSWHVLEHIYDPHPVIAEFRRILRPGGLFVCEVPNLGSWQAQIGQGNWFHLDVPRHLTHYTLAAMNSLLDQHGLQVVSVHTFSPELGWFGMFQTLLNRMGLSPNWLFQWLKRSNRPGSGILVVHILAACIALIPSLFIEVLASMLGRGGVIRVLARK